MKVKHRVLQLTIQTYPDGKQLFCSPGRGNISQVNNVFFYHCALDVTMDYIGGKWKAVVLWYLRKGPKRFSALKRNIPDITEKMLSLQLKQLQADGIIDRKIYAEVPPRVEYFFTKEGETLIPALEEIASWGRHMGEKYGELEEIKNQATPSKKSGK